MGRGADSVWQHQELKDKLQQRWSDWLESAGGEESGQKLQEMEQLKIETEALERIPKRKEDDQRQARMRTLTVQVEKEVLQTRVVNMEEVRANPNEWKEAFKKEYDTLTAGPVTPISQQEFDNLVKSKVEMEILPMKGVATLKPPNRHKARIVVCGNYSTNVPDVDTSVGGSLCHNNQSSSTCGSCERLANGQHRCCLSLSSGSTTEPGQGGYHRTTINLENLGHHSSGRKMASTVSAVRNG